MKQQIKSNETFNLEIAAMGSASVPEVDALLVGAGFGAFTMLNKLRKQGLSVKVYEKGASSGGIWYW